MLPILFHPATSKEIKTSFDWYQKQVKGLGHDFIQELELVFNSVQSLPFTWPKIGQSHRRFVLSRFPFSLIYEVINEKILVVAIMNNHRKPNYWNDRN